MTDILIIEDQEDIAALLCDFLKPEGYCMVHVKSGEEGIHYLEEFPVRLVLLDLMLPGIDGFEVCKWIHEVLNLPLIILSAKTDKADKLNGLTLGADDYIEKPYDIDLLIAKIHTLYRRHYLEESRGGVIIEGDFRIDTNGRTVYRKGELLNLTVKEYDLLLLLMENKGKTLHKEFMFNRVWGLESFSEPSTLTVHIKWLREKVEANPKVPSHILTVWGVGYKFTG